MEVEAAYRRLFPVAAALVVAATSVSGAAAARSGVVPQATSKPEPETLADARGIRAQLNARQRRLPGRKLIVTEATSMAVVDSLTLLPDLRVVSASNGIYFAVCSLRARCPYPARSAAWPAVALGPRRLALELAVRTFVKTRAALVVVALPTTRPVWVVFEREEFATEPDASVLLGDLAPQAAVSSVSRHIVDRLTLSRLFVPVAIAPSSPTTETFLAVSLVSD